MSALLPRSGPHTSVPVQPTLVTGLHVVTDGSPASFRPASSSPPPSGAVKATQLPWEGASDGTVHAKGFAEAPPEPVVVELVDVAVVWVVLPPVPGVEPEPGPQPGAAAIAAPSERRMTRTPASRMGPSLPPVPCHCVSVTQLPAEGEVAGALHANWLAAPASPAPPSPTPPSPTGFARQRPSVDDTGA